MAELIQIITNKPDWRKKIKDTSILATWKEEISQQGIPAKVLDAVLTLLQDYSQRLANDYEGDNEYDWDVQLGVSLENDLHLRCSCDCYVCAEGRYPPSDDEEEQDDEEKKRRIQPCLCGDDFLSNCCDSFLQRFTRVIDSFNDHNLKRNLQQQAEQLERSFTELDYHPNTNNQVVDLVHPSLYCYIKDVTELSEEAKEYADENAIFQWLPAEFKVHRVQDENAGETEGRVERVSIESPINNLPQETNGELYQSIAQVFAHMVPHFDSLLAELHTSGRLVSRDGIPVKLADCQVIVKLANTVLEPRQVFRGGHWHLEGMATEHIVATGIYYYDVTNIREHALEFRATIDDVDSVSYPQDGMDYVERHYGMGLNERNDQRYGRIMESTITLGDLKTKQDMMLIFPNFLQHKVSEMSLQDSNTPGKRKILCFFLINPYKQVLSTMHVPPQQGTMSLEDAKLFRELLMFQRKYQIDDQTSFFERGWSLCEH